MPLRIPKSGPLKGQKVYVDSWPMLDKKTAMMPLMHKLPSLDHGAPAESWAKPLRKK
jgi:hypothetical protein